jgi:acyl-CoA synthetase (AMP-forming)/AMP-acid ligase II
VARPPVTASAPINLADLHEAIAAAVPDRECIVSATSRRTYREVAERTSRLANVLAAHGLGLHRERSDLEPWESGQDHVALYLHNGAEYLETMLAAFRARTVPLNVNYRYVEEELVQLLASTDATAVVFHATFAPMVAEVRKQLPRLALLIQVADGSGHPLVDGALDYEDIIAAASGVPTGRPRSPDDLYALCTGGTTGRPKAVLWRQADILAATLTPSRDPATRDSIETIVRLAVASDPGPRYLPGPPFMHGSGQWFAFVALHSGGTVVLPDDPTRFDAADVLRVIERERVNGLNIVGDAFGRPILEALAAGGPRPATLRFIASGGAAFSTPVKAALLAELPGIMLVDTLGSSETGAQGQNIAIGSVAAEQGVFGRTPDTAVLNDARNAFLEPTDTSEGWLARLGAIPFGYLGDEERTRATFPVVDGVRCSVPGDRVRWREDGLLEFAGRDSVTINSGGEKIFAEEVEAALKAHADVHDAVVIGRPSERWGQEVVALIQLRPGASATDDDVLDVCGRHVARYKLPKQILRFDDLHRSPAGKADYAWARDQLV